ncbi:putative reverse transcriptase domain-containing protein, partial [Tanacetum coccineum]
MHYARRFTDFPNKQYVECEIFFVDMIDIGDFKIELVNTVLSCIGYEDDDDLLLYYKIPLKSLDIGLKPLDSVSDINNFLGYVNKHKMMYVYVEKVEKIESSSDEEGEGDSESEDGNDFVDEEHLLDEVEVNMSSFKFQIDGEDDTKFIDLIVPNFNVTKDDLEVLDFDSLESDQDDVPENARNRGLRKLRKEHMSYGIRNNFYVGKEFPNRDLAKERIRAYVVETRRNLDFKIKRCTSIFLSKQITDLLTMNPQIPIKAIQEHMQKKVHVSVSKHKAFRAKAHVYLRGDVKVQYSLLRDYANELQRCNPDTTCGILESENQYSWTWFLTCLADDFDLFSNSNFTFITDRQKGLLPIIAKLFPSVEHRFCVRHINENMNLTWKGGDYKEMLWRQINVDGEEKKNRKIDCLARSLLIQWLPNDIYSLIDSNNYAKELWDALERHMLGSEYGEQDWKAVVLYEYETFKATKGELLLDTYIRYLQVINDLKKCGYKKDNCELNFKFLNNLQPEWKQYGTTMRQNKNLMDINIDALYNILKQDQGDVNEAMSHKKKAVVVTSDPFALVAEKTIVSKSREKVVIQSDSEGSDDEDISDLKKITALLAKAFNRKKYYVKPTNNNLRTSSASSSANKKPEYVKLEKKTEDKKLDEKKRDMSKVKCYNCKKNRYFAKDYKKAKDSEESSSSAEETIADVSYYTFDYESKSEYETSEYYDNSTNYGVFVDNDDDQEI